ncbi:MAG: hypothetical protein ABII00_14515 [Elusimicrobiota bacterium]
MAVEAELVESPPFRRKPGDGPCAGGTRVRAYAVRGGSFWGALFAGGTTLAALGMMGLLLLFGRLILVSAAVTLLWPLVFSPEFTLWVFGADTVPFWKILLLLALAELALKWFRRGALT